MQEESKKQIFRINSEETSTTLLEFKQLGQLTFREGNYGGSICRTIQNDQFIFDPKISLPYTGAVEIDFEDALRIDPNKHSFYTGIIYLNLDIPKIEVIHGKMKHKANPNFLYGEEKTLKATKDGKEKTYADGRVVTEPAAIDGETEIGNKEVKAEEISPITVYQADSSLEQTTEGTKGKKITTTIYKVNSDTGLTNDVEGAPTIETVPVKDKIIKIGNVDKKTTDIAFKIIYVADDTLPYNTRKGKIAGQTGYKIDIITYKVNKSTGLTTDVDSRKEEKVDPTERVIRVDNKQVTHEGKKTITTTYDVDKDTGKLTNPKKHTSVPIGILTPSKHSPKTVTFKNGDSKIGSVKVEAGKAIATDGLIDQSMPNNPSKEELIRAIKS